MDAKAKFKAKLPSRHVTEGPDASFGFYDDATGPATEKIHRPFADAEQGPGRRRCGQGAVLAIGGNLAAEGAIVKVVGMRKNVRLLKAELDRCRQGWRPRQLEFTSEYLWEYAEQVGPARGGTITHPGGTAKKKCYADI